MSIDTIGDFLTVIRNGVMVNKSFASVPFSRMKHDIALILKNEGFLRDVSVIDEAGRKKLKIYFKYVNGESVIHEITRESKLGRRLYSGSRSLKPVIGGLGISVLTTDRGLVTDKQAKKLGVGGEIICSVW